MAEQEKIYNHAPALILNVINDIAEMRKARVTHSAQNELDMETDMYGIKTAYCFKLTRGTAETKLKVASGGEDEIARQNVAVMFTLLDGMLDVLLKNKSAEQ